MLIGYDKFEVKITLAYFHNYLLFYSFR